MGLIVLESPPFLFSILKLYNLFHSSYMEVSSDAYPSRLVLK